MVDDCGRIQEEVVVLDDAPHAAGDDDPSMLPPLFLG
jgi:hypothetical protein